ncbi:hypothetical protein [Streptomyces pacificus]|uniref:Uncharacterized protein n=1 Tax=Streptomyces pacificus TaxID=2705029 RepID=A0A6A0B2G0_9ACTN|nr:hypothetical protein [Streptomyces pacificus]GFH37967.1 hypothetical protein SCWH03_42070 [Streptomyces pacificus]
MPRGTRRRPGHAPARPETDEQTPAGAVHVRSLMRSQLRAALYALGTLVLLVGTLPLLFVLPAAVLGSFSPSAPFVWAVLGAGVYPLMWLTARRYVRRAERNEEDFTGLVEGR